MISATESLRDLQTHFRSGETLSYESRIKALNLLEKIVVEQTDQFCEALAKDFRKPRMEALIGEVGLILEEIRLTKAQLHRWMKPLKKKSPLALWPGTSRIYREPLGVVLIIGPWNYPLMLTLVPLVGVLAAGNCAVIKPSELTPHISALIHKVLTEAFPPHYVQVIEGGIPETTALLEKKFDHIFFTGSTPVGRIVMQAAAKNLVPVTLELGGKSPAIVCEDADLDLAARRLVWGKFYNAGQTCVAPDFVCLHRSIAPQMIEKMKQEIHRQFGDNPQTSQSLSRIVNKKNWDRLVNLIPSKKLLQGGRVDEQELYIEPTLIGDVDWSDPLMQDEIFGPLLPLLVYDRLDELLMSLKEKPKPLAAYLFSKSRQTQDFFTGNFSFGGGCLNDVLVHLSNPHLPFGGVGDSGLGRYHGESSFEAFSHHKSVVRSTGWFDFKARYAPYNEKKISVLRRIFGI